MKELKQGVATSVHNMGNIYWELGDYDKALGSYKQSLGIAKEIGEKGRVVFSLFHIGDIYRELGNYEASLTCGKEGEKIAREIGAKRYLIHCLEGKAKVYNEIGEFARALEALEEALDICEQLELKHEKCIVLSALSETIINSCPRENAVKKAKDYLDKGWEISAEIRSSEAMYSILSAYVKFHLFTRNYEVAKDYSQKLLNLFKETKRKDFSFGEALHLMGRSLDGVGKKSKAKKYFSESLSSAKKMGLKPLINKIQSFGGNK